jgi:DNA-binding PadR family transcriptional regulator
MEKLMRPPFDDEMLRRSLGRGHSMMGRIRGRHGGEPLEAARRSRRLFDSRELRLLLLGSIAEQPRHGYDLIRAMEEASGGQYAPSPGMVYPMLAAMSKIGVLDVTTDESVRKNFAITAEGRRELDARFAELAELRDRLKGLTSKQATIDATPVRRAMNNLRAALEGRLAQDATTRSTVLEVAALIDEAAGRIERL